MRRRALLMIATVAACLTGPASAREPWPQPAAGASASGGPEVIFSFDDGPWEPTTAQILDVLAIYDIHAIFFLVGRQFYRRHTEQHRDLALRMIRDGHVIGNHSMTHAKLCGLDDTQVDTEIAGSRQVIEEVISMPVPWYRVPYGSRCQNIEDGLLRHGLQHFHWDIDPQEWQGKTWRATADAVIRKLARLDGRAVVLMHDTKIATTHALPAILSWIAIENVKRTATGRRPIRILSGSDLAAEQAAPTLDWMTHAIATAERWTSQTLTANIP